MLLFKDPYSVKIESIVKGSSEVIEYAGQPVIARKYFMSINAKNTYGAYVGEKVYLCYLSEDDQRLLKISRPGE